MNITKNITKGILGYLIDIESTISNTILVEDNTPPYKKQKKKDDDISFLAELKRKSIHIFSLLIPIIYIFVSKSVAVPILFVLMAAHVVVDLLSKRNDWVREQINKYFGDILRKHENKKDGIYLNGASCMMISAFFVVLIFPKFVAVVAMTIIVICDLSSAIFGKRFGRNEIFKKKSLEGSVAFFLAGITVIWAYFFIFNPGIIFLIFGFLGVFLSTFGEAVSKIIRIDDNIIVPAIMSITLYLGELYAHLLNQTFIYILH
ncbi:MAG TPA: dolichol kinase [Candidatus Kapabacteria bacterium]|jgi:dolichol kinase|nr:dolichol kinase [Candidatus Kapabacteria bacterium]HOV93144.1 dolichol kinase [Candidatus Kapabacteria bacterium]